MRYISLRTKNIIGAFICGFFWVASGILTQLGSTTAILISGVTLIGAGASMLAVMLMGAVEGDEMAEIHFLKTKARTYDSIVMTFLIFSLIGAGYKMVRHEELITNWHAWVMIFIGIMQLVSGITFERYEKGGD